MTPLPITSLFVALFAIALVALSLPISLRRMKVGVLVGEGADDTLRRRIRAQGNFIEYVPLSLLALGIVEMHGAPTLLIVSIGGTLTLGRALHAIGMLRNVTALRGFGMTLTYVSLCTAAVRLLLDAGA